LCSLLQSREKVVSVMTDVADLLDQCSPEELQDILKSLESGSLSSPPMKSMTAPLSVQNLQPSIQPPRAQAQNPVPPAKPPPAASGRRPSNKGLTEEVLRDVGGSTEPAQLTRNEIKALMEQHSETVVHEVQKLLSSTEKRMSVPASTELQSFGSVSMSQQHGDTFDLGTLTRTLTERDSEVLALEKQLDELQMVLADKDRRVEELTGELDKTVREVRHKQLDLEFQQLKLEERVRSNSELEQAQRKLTAHVEEASLNARHAALDMDMSVATPRALRAQGSLPWTVRKNRLPAVSVPAIRR